MTKERSKKLLLVTLACLLYFTSYITRLNFNAALADIVANTPLTNSQGGLISMALFVAYGVGQIFIGFLGDKIKPQLIIALGLVVTAACNVVFPLWNNLAFLIAIWTVNGLAQAAFWPPLIRMLASGLDKHEYTRAIILVGVAANAAIVLLYLIVPLLLVSLGWTSVFYFSAGFAVLVVPIWWIGTAKATTVAPVPTTEVAGEAAATTTPQKSKGFGKLMLACNLPCILVAIAVHGYLKDGLTTWMPTYLVETFAFGTSVSILMNVVLPIVSLVALIVAGLLQGRVFRNEMTASIFYFALSTVAMLLMFFFADTHAALSVTLSSLTVGCMYGVNLMLISELPTRFVKQGKVSTMSGISNAFTYLGSALSSYLIAMLAERIGWQYSALFWCGLSVLGTVVCIAALKPWKKFIAAYHEPTEQAATKDAETTERAAEQSADTTE